MRSLVLLLVGLFTGAALALIGTNYLRRGTAYPNGVMVVMGAQLKSMDRSITQARCTTPDFLPRLQTVRYIANEIEPAFAEMNEDTQFIRYASDLRAAVDTALATPPASCKAAAAALSQIDKTCDACHRDYKN